MASTYTSSLRLEKIGIGESDNTWGTTLNTQLDLISDSVAGLVSVSVSTGAHYLTFINGLSDTSRKHTIVATGADTGAFNIVAPAVPKTYLVQNKATGGNTMTFKCSSGTGVTIPANTAMYVFCDGVSVRAASTPVNDAGSPVYTSVAASLGLFNGLVATSASIGSMHITGALVVDGATTLGTTTTGALTASVLTVQGKASVSSFSAVSCSLGTAQASSLLVNGVANVSSLSATSVYASVGTFVNADITHLAATTAAVNYLVASSASIGNLSIGTASGAPFATAWVNFNGTTGAIMKSYGVEGVTRTATGSYTVSLTNSQPSADYCIQLSSWDAAGQRVTGNLVKSFSFQTLNTAGAASDVTRAYAVVFS